MQSLRRTLLNPRPLTTLRAFSTTRPSSIARMSLIGRLAATPELTSTSTSRDLIRYAIGSSSGPADNRHTSWFRIGAFVGEGNLRDFMLRQEKGTLVSVEADGEMRNLETEAGSRQILNLKQRESIMWSSEIGEEIGGSDANEFT
ncbi:MAG: hypothetical protein M1828_004029 [Chrysothrix sp. TS-e1954]|nr:MAG: hypothetical protein M1828_004029 [Chrysothrix sp. TS-e1954]